MGDLVFRGPNATKGYFKLPDETREKIRDGWVYTGDHAYRDDDGYFYIVGREKELIISGGYNIYPKEIEEVIHAHRAVSEVAVIGVADPVKGEVPKAFIALKPGCDGDRGGTGGTLQGEPCPVQAAENRLRQGAAEEPDRKDREKRTPARIEVIILK